MGNEGSHAKRTEKKNCWKMSDLLSGMFAWKCANFVFQWTFKSPNIKPWNLLGKHPESLLKWNYDVGDLDLFVISL